MLITFEGIDGCGKSTQIDLLKNYFNREQVSYHVFREPGGTEISERIRSLLLHETAEMDPVTELLLFSAARSQLIREKVIPLLEKGEMVILDRFYDSTTAYQGYGRKSAGLSQIHTLNQLAAHSLVPDLTFYLKISPHEAARRTSGGEKDRMENSGLSFFDAVQQGYDELAAQNTRFITVDASLPADQVHGEIVRKIRAFR